MQPSDARPCFPRAAASIGPRRYESPVLHRAGGLDPLVQCIHWRPGHHLPSGARPAAPHRSRRRRPTAPPAAARAYCRVGGACPRAMARHRHAGAGAVRCGCQVVRRRRRRRPNRRGCAVAGSASPRRLRRHAATAACAGAGVALAAGGGRAGSAQARAGTADAACAGRPHPAHGAAAAAQPGGRGPSTVGDVPAQRGGEGGGGGWGGAHGGGRIAKPLSAVAYRAVCSTRGSGLSGLHELASGSHVGGGGALSTQEQDVGIRPGEVVRAHWSVALAT
eukprot:scaffold5068_cov112-Isochrysis_galbana.AAC.1